MDRIDAGPGSPRDILHHLRKAMIPWPQWDAAGGAIAARLNDVNPGLGYGTAGLDAKGEAALAALKRNAVAPLGALLSTAQADEAAAFLTGQPGFSGHHMNSSDGVEHSFGELVAGGARYCAYRPETAMKAPHLMALANRDDILAIVERAMGCVPTLYSVNAWWSFPVPGDPWPPNSQHFHRDDDDFRFFTLFVYLTDVGSLADGPNQIAPGSHTLEGLNALIAEAAAGGRLTPDQQTVDNLLAQWPQPITLVETAFAPRIVATLGPRGTGLLADTRALHRGHMPRERRRCIFWARYGLGPNSNSSDVDLSGGLLRAGELGAPIPDTPRHRHVNRLLVRWD